MILISLLKNLKFKNIRSTILLNQIIDEVKNKGYLINNIDINIITEKLGLIGKEKAIACEVIASVIKYD